MKNGMLKIIHALLLIFPKAINNHPYTFIKLIPLTTNHV